MRRLHRPGVQHVRGADDQVVGVQREPGDVQRPRSRAGSPRRRRVVRPVAAASVMPAPPGGPVRTRRGTCSRPARASPRGRRRWPGGRRWGCPPRAAPPRRPPRCPGSTAGRRARPRSRWPAPGWPRPRRACRLFHEVASFRMFVGVQTVYRMSDLFS